MDNKNSSLPPVPAQPPTQSTVGAPTPEGSSPGPDVSLGSKSVVIGVGVLVVVAIVLFLVRQGFVNWLVGSLKRSPNAASLSGWGLFGALFFGAAVAALAFVNPALLVLVYVGPLVGLALICLVVCLLSAMRR
jgi:hypothetical protein